MNPDTRYVCDGCDDDSHTCGKDTDECEQEIVDARANAADLERKSRLEDGRWSLMGNPLAVIGIILATGAVIALMVAFIRDDLQAPDIPRGGAHVPESGTDAHCSYQECDTDLDLSWSAGTGDWR